ncbi:hypothetical protein BST95_01435 [Halioglobus japonicus]|uniref:Nitroreductase family deazaflavin-dependent oxidoreductase n=1 Tax=Halioglobus japonicus TaxID=930805 RepID=A0AAP8MBX9_9GAMM|nr:nitroreductase family deazaflavin-dependent oxidoreductase [Halioglobus japonicus]AQA17074.1 hypothetical protein BST95_01435 [Halioglobus japonicus]PLW84983.1 nitroreductase family deazaflavin-dependent oxidoreductase [Halioglobus japonicus]GHD18850.1 hypothetical protein GCM10007052_26640 [Halioglobus japonicus]
MELIRSDLLKNALASDIFVSVLKRTVPPTDKALLRLTRGWLNTGLQSVVLLDTTGARSGQRRTIATLCMPMGRDLVLVGSNWGQERDPAWVHNLRANDKCYATFRGYVGPMNARELKGAERAAIWKHLVRFNPQYARYQKATSRRLPVLVLERDED